MSRSKTVSFFHILDDSTPSAELLNVDWSPLLNTLARPEGDASLPEIPLGDAMFLLEVMSAEDSSFLVHRVKDYDEWLRVRRQGRRPEDLRATLDGDLLETSCVQFVHPLSVFGLVRGSASAPGHAMIAKVLQYVSDFARLIARPITVPEQLDRVADAQGVRGFDIKISSDASWTPPNQGVFRTIRNLMESTGREVSVQVSVSVGRKKASSPVLDHLLDLLAPGGHVPQLPAGSRGTASIINEEGDRELVNLVQHSLALKVEFGDDTHLIERALHEISAFGAAHRPEIELALGVRGQLDD